MSAARRGRRARVSTAAALAAALAAATAARAPHARVEILADSTAVPPGGGVTLGLRFALDEGWHIYWRNPGESGGPPIVAWKAPPELVVGELQWPTPERFIAPGDTTYGYQHRVMLLAPARYSGSARLGAIPIQAVVDYQICRDVCLKETARPATTLALGPPDPSPAAAEFAEARTRLPVPAPADWKATATASPGEFVLTIETGQREAAGRFFPYRSGLIDDSAPQRIDPRASGLSLYLRKAKGSSAPAGTLDGLFVRPGVRAVEVKAPVRSG